MSTENRDPLDNTTVDDPSFALNSNVNVDDFEIERTIVRQRQTAIYNQIVRDAANRNSSSAAAAAPPAAAAAAAPVEPPPPAAAAAAAAASEYNCPSHHVYIMSSFSCQRPDLMQVITAHLRTLEGHPIEPAVARAAARAAVAVIIAARTDPDARAAIDRAEAEYQALLADVAAAATELPAAPAAAAAVVPEPSEPPAAAIAATPTATAKATGKKRKRPTEEAKGHYKQKNKTVRVEEDTEYELRYDSDFEWPIRVKKTKKTKKTE